MDSEPVGYWVTFRDINDHKYAWGGFQRTKPTEKDLKDAQAWDNSGRDIEMLFSPTWKDPDSE